MKLHRLLCLAAVTHGLTSYLAAAPVAWTGAAGDNSWHTPANWSGGFVPVSTNDVVINVAGNPTIAHTTGTTTVRSIQCDEACLLAGGAILVTSGATAVNGPTTFTSAGSFSVDGAGATVTVNGPLLRAQSNLTARRGSRINLPTLTSLVMTNDGLLFSAYDAGTVLDLSHVTNLVIYPNVQFQVYAYSGATVDLHQLANPSGGFYAYATGAGSRIDLAGFAGRLVNQSQSGFQLEAWSGGALALSNVIAMDGVDLVLRNNGQIPTSQLTEFTRGFLVLNAVTNIFSALTNLFGASVELRAGAKVAFSNITHLAVSNANVNFTVRDPGTLLDLSSLTNLFGDPQLTFGASAYSGARLDLHRLPRPSVGFSGYADGSAAILDLSGFSGRISTAANMALEVRNSASIQMPNVTELDGVDLTIRNNGQIATAQLTSLTRATLFVFTSTNNFGSLRDIQDTDIEVRTGAKLALPGIHRLLITNGNVQLTARDAGTILDLSAVTNITVGAASGLYVTALTGGRVDLHNVARFSEGRVQVVATDPGSTVDLSALRCFICPNPNSVLRSSIGGLIAFGTEPCLMGNATIDLAGAQQPPFAAARDLLVLRAQPWRSYLVEMRPADGSNGPWKYVAKVPVTNSFQLVGKMPPGNLEFRAQEFIANPSLLDLGNVTNRAARLVLYGTPGKNYRIFTAATLNPPVNWQPGPAIAMTNSFRLLPLDLNAAPMSFFRAQEE